MVDLLYRMIYFVARVHDWIMTLNDGAAYMYSDKTLHFVVMGLTGMAILLVSYAFITLLGKRGHFLTIAFVYAMTLVIVITFAVEIGQWLSGTGSMEFEDMQAGIMGFLYMFVIFAVVRALVVWIYRLIRGEGKHEAE